MNALRNTQPSMLAYLSYMTERLLPMKDILKPTGSIYLHCDPTASHHIKIMMDAIFGHKNFRNEIIWSYKRWTTKSKAKLNSTHDILLWYSKGDEITFNYPMLKNTNPNPSQYVSTKDEKGKTIVKRDAEGKAIKRKVASEIPATDVWNLPIISPASRERLGYATQKPLVLLERIIKTSSNEGDLIFDPFCGCATTIEAAHKLNRNWIGIDIAIHAVKRVSKARLQDRLGLVEDKDYIIEGVPLTMEGAHDLWERDKYHFQKWAIEQVDGFVTTRKTGDGGIDGRIYFAETGMSKDLSSMVVEVKGGKSVGISDVRNLRGVMEREGVSMAGLIVLKSPKERQAMNFHREMAQAGDLDVGGKKYARMQLLTIEEILDGKRFNIPGLVATREKSEPVLPGLKLQ